MSRLNGHAEKYPIGRSAPDLGSPPEYDDGYLESIGVRDDGREAKTEDLPKLKARKLSSLANKPVPSVEFLIPEMDMFPMGKLSSFYGDGGLGKSTIIGIELALSRALDDTPWMDLAVKRGRTVFISCEDDEDDIHARAVRICQDRDLNIEEADDFVYVDLVGQMTELGVIDLQSRSIVPSSLYKALTNFIKEFGADCVIVDGAAHTFGGNEISKTEVRQYLDLLTRWARELGAAVILLAHPSKSEMNSGNGAGGSVHWNNGVRHRVYMERDRGTEAEHEDPDVRVITVKKSNFGKDGQSIRLRNCDGIFRRDDGETQTAEQTNFKVTLKFLELLLAFEKENQFVGTNPGKNYAPSTMAKDPDSGGIKASAFAKVMKTMLREDVIQKVGSGPPSRHRYYLHINRENGRTRTLLQQLKGL